MVSKHLLTWINKNKMHKCCVFVIAFTSSHDLCFFRKLQSWFSTFYDLHSGQPQSAHNKLLIWQLVPGKVRLLPLMQNEFTARLNHTHNGSGKHFVPTILPTPHLHWGCFKLDTQNFVVNQPLVSLLFSVSGSTQLLIALGNSGRLLSPHQVHTTPKLML